MMSEKKNTWDARENSVFSYSESMKEETSDKISRAISFVDIYLNRPVAGLIVRLIYNTRVTPNQVSWFSFLLGLLSAGCFVWGEYRWFLAGGIFFQLSSIVDGADGMLARARNQKSSYGAYLDLLFDRILDFANLAAIPIGLYLSGRPIYLLIIGLTGAGLYLLQILQFYLVKSYSGSTQTGETGESRAVMIFLIFLFAVLNRLEIAVVLGLCFTIIVNISWFTHFIRLGGRDR